ncbi:MAG: RAD55 family ATPase [Thermoplasmatota archaeon]
MEGKDGESCFGVDQLDNITLGKILPGSLGLFHGPAGCGKSSMLYHFLFQGAGMNNNVCFITNEPPDRISSHMSSFRTFQSNWLKDGYISIFNIQDLMGLIGMDLENTGPQDVDLFFDLLVQVVQHLDAKRLVIDPVNPLLEILEDWNKVFFLQRLKGKLVELGVSTFMAMDTNLPLHEMDLRCMEPYNFNIIIGFKKEKEPPVILNTMTIERWKGTSHAKNTYVIEVSKDGVFLVPRIKPLEVR